MSGGRRRRLTDSSVSFRQSCVIVVRRLVFRFAGRFDPEEQPSGFRGSRDRITLQKIDTLVSQYFPHFAGLDFGDGQLSAEDLRNALNDLKKGNNLLGKSEPWRYGCSDRPVF